LAEPGGGARSAYGRAARDDRRGGFPGSITIERLMERVRTIARRTAVLRTEFGEALDDDKALKALL
jgi:hypothetical protein